MEAWVADFSSFASDLGTMTDRRGRGLARGWEKKQNTVSGRSHCTFGGAPPVLDRLCPSLSSEAQIQGLRQSLCILEYLSFGSRVATLEMDHRSTEGLFAKGRVTVRLKVRRGLLASRQHVTVTVKLTASFAQVHKRMVAGVAPKKDQKKKVSIDFLPVEATALRNHGGQACSDSALHPALTRSGGK